MTPDWARTVDPRAVVAAKRDGREVDPEALRQFVLGYGRGVVPDYLAAAFLMAAYIRGLSPAETSAMTRAMVESGATVPLRGVRRPKVDKHSTGGVSDGVTLVLAPLVAALGLALAKLSGRGLGHTGGTLDKLEAIPGLRTDLSPEEMERQVDQIGCAVAAQSSDLVPADGAFYALRDATGTVASVPLIAASVMAKKLAVATDLILLDVKAGAGAFMKSPSAAGELASVCAGLADDWGRQARIAVTDMSQPLGRAIGNALDVAEAVRVLRGEEGGRLRDLCVAFAAEALGALTGADRTDALRRCQAALDTGTAAEAFGRMVKAQGGDPRVVEDEWGVLPRAPIIREVPSPWAAGYLQSVRTEALGDLAAALGAGRKRKGDPLDPAVGIEFLPKVGDRLGELPLAVVHARTEEAAALVADEVPTLLTVSEDPVAPPPLVYGWQVGGAREGNAG